MSPSTGPAKDLQSWNKQGSIPSVLIIHSPDDSLSSDEGTLEAPCYHSDRPARTGSDRTSCIDARRWQRQSCICGWCCPRPFCSQPRSSPCMGPHSGWQLSRGRGEQPALSFWELSGSVRSWLLQVISYRSPYLGACWNNSCDHMSGQHFGRRWRLSWKVILYVNVFILVKTSLEDSVASPSDP